MSQASGNKPVVLIGIDWADKRHSYAAVGPDGKPRSGIFEQTPGDIAEWINDWKKKYPDASLAIAIETTRGALINALMEYPQVIIYPVNPAAMAYFRKSFKHGGGKSDDIDAALILKYLRTNREELRPLLRKYPTLEAIQKAGQVKLRKLFFATGTKQAIERRIELLLNAIPITTNKATIETSARLCQCIVVQMELLNSAIKGYDKEIQEKGHQAP